MKRLIMVAFMALMMMTSVFAYGGGGGGIFLPFPSGDRYDLFKDSVNEVKTYDFACSSYSDVVDINNYHVLRLICPKDYLLRGLKYELPKVVQTFKAEVYSFTPKKPVEVSGKSVTQAMLVKSNQPLASPEVIVQFENKPKAYASQDSNHWYFLKTEKVGVDLYKLVLEPKQKYLIFTE